MSMRIAITGGTGFLGQALTDAWRRAGHTVTVLTRHASRDGEMAWSPADILEPVNPAAPWIAEVQHANVVVNLAGESLMSGRWTAARKAAIRASRVDATRALVLAFESAATPPAVFLSGSAIGIYGDRGDERLTEASATGDGFLADVCVAWEQSANAARRLTRVVLLRTGIVLGPGGGALPQMALPFRFFAGGPIGAGDQYLSWIHRDDWLQLVIEAAGNATFKGPVNLTAPNPVRNRDLARTLGHVLGRPSFMPAPAFALRLVLGEMADEALLAGQRVLPEAARTHGYRFKYPELEAALRSIYR